MQRRRRGKWRLRARQCRAHAVRSCLHLRARQAGKVATSALPATMCPCDRNLLLHKASCTTAVDFSTSA